MLSRSRRLLNVVCSGVDSTLPIGWDSDSTRCRLFTCFPAFPVAPLYFASDVARVDMEEESEVERGERLSGKKVSYWRILPPPDPPILLRDEVEIVDGASIVYEDAEGRIDTSVRAPLCRPTFRSLQLRICRMRSQLCLRVSVEVWRPPSVEGEREWRGENVAEEQEVEMMRALLIETKRMEVWGYVGATIQKQFLKKLCVRTGVERVAFFDVGRMSGKHWKQDALLLGVRNTYFFSEKGKTLPPPPKYVVKELLKKKKLRVFRMDWLGREGFCFARV